jgi:hypothetical protein
LLRPKGVFVFALHDRDRQPALARHAQHGCGGVEGKGPSPGSIGRCGFVGRRALGSGDDEAAADRIVGFADQRGAGFVDHREDQGVGMSGQRWPEIEDDVGGRIEGERWQADWIEQACLVKLRKLALGAVRVEIGG